MTVDEYLEATGESLHSLASRAGVNRQTIYNIREGKGCHAESAHRLILASQEKPAPDGGTIGLNDITGVE